MERATQKTCPIKIDYTKISPADLKNLCRTLVDAALEFYKDPKNLEGFERWQRERMKKDSIIE